MSRASEESWDSLALVGTEPSLFEEYLDARGWPPGTVFRLSSWEELLPHLRTVLTLRRLAIVAAGIGVTEAGAIAAGLTQLTTLDLRNNSVGDEGARALATGLSQLTNLSLGYNGVGDAGAEAIAVGLARLNALDLAYNRVTDIGAKAIATNLPQLTTLDLGYNSVTDTGAKAIATNLPQLTTLDLGYNGVTGVGAKAIATGLARLTTLSLSGNKVGNTGATAIATGLARLTTLCLGYTGLGQAGATAIAANLHQLITLDLSHNKVGQVGANAILHAQLGASTLRSLDLTGNGLTGGAFLPELLQTTDAPALVTAYRRLATAPPGELQRLNEAKLVVVGNEAVGKTSLVRYLTTGQPRDPTERKTSGAAIHERIETQAWRPEGSPILLNVWDFGGQEIMHGTHRFFLSERTLYLIVLEARREDDNSVDNWLKTVRNRGGDSPVIVVVNKCDEGTHRLRLDETALFRDYPNVVAVLTTSCEPTAFAIQSIARLRHVIADTVADDPRLGHARDPIPAPWLKVKAALAQLAREQSLLESGTFLALCTRGDDADRITDPNEQTTLLRLLHDLGVVVAHGLGRDAPAALREVTLLDPNWLTGAVYALLTSLDILVQGGEFSREQLPRWLDRDRYPPQRHEYILDMMQSSDLGLCFRLPTPAPQERYLLPEALPANEPDYEMWPADSLRFRYEYHFLAPGMIPRFIVQAHRHLTVKPTRWRTGVVLEVDGCPVLVKADRERRRIDVAVAGPPNLRRTALAIVRYHLSVVHTLNPEAQPVARVPLPGDPGKSVAYDDLLNWESHEGSTYAFYPEGSVRKYVVGELLEGVRTGGGIDPEHRSDATSPSPSNAGGPRTWSPAEATRLGLFMVVSIVALVLVFVLVERLAGAGTATGMTSVALAAVLAVAAFMLRASGRLSQENFLALLKQFWPGRN